MEISTEAQNNAQIVLDHIEQHPEQHDQGSWAEKSPCGTTGCVAGWTLMLCDGWQYYGGRGSGLVDNEYRETTTKSIVSTARDLLGLDDHNARMLFTLEDEETAREALRYIANGKHIDWEKIGAEHNTSRMYPTHW